MDRRSFQEELERATREIYLDQIHEYIDERFEGYRQQIRYISALNRRHETWGEVSEGLGSILASVGKNLEPASNGNTFEQRYESAVNRLAARFPDLEEWRQGEERFRVQDNDSSAVAAGKKLKSLWRRVSGGWRKPMGDDERKKGWVQLVPLHNMVRRHFQDAEMAAQWLHAMERVQLDIINELEEFLVSHSGAEGDAEAIRTQLDDLVKTLRQKVDDRQKEVRQRVQSGAEAKKAKVRELARKAGTFEHSDRMYRENRVLSRQDRVRGQLRAYSEKWTKVQQLFHERTCLVREYVDVRSDIERQCSDLLENIEAHFSEMLDQPLQKLREMLESGKGESEADEIRKLKERLSEHVESVMTVPIQKMTEEQVLTKKIEHFFGHLLSSANRVSQDGSVLFDVNLDKNPPEVSSRSIEWRLLVVRSVREHLVNTLQPYQKEYERFTASVLEELREIDDIIEINLESALDAEEQETARKGEAPETIASEALQRLTLKVESLQQQSEEKREHFERLLTEGQEAFSHSLLALVHEGDVKELQMLNAKYKAKETTQGWRTIVLSRLARVQDRLAVWGRFAWQKTKSAWQSLGTFLGFEEKQIEEMKRADIATYLSETDQKMKELPYIYRRLFNFDAVADERFYVPVIDSTSTFRKAYERWKQEFPATFAVVGEKGSGKSTFLNINVESELNGEPEIHITLEQTIWSEKQLVDLFAEKIDAHGAETVQDIIDAINGWEERKALIIECMQNSFVRNLNGYEAIEKLCYLVSETKQSAFWIVSCSRYAWRFLDKTVQLSEYFSHITTSDNLDADQVKKVIMSRHRSSGYSLSFDAGEELLNARGYRKLMDQEEEAQQYLQENYFKKLTELAEGNASVAMIFWIRSIRKFDDTCCYIQPLEVTSVEMIEDLRPPVLFTLAAFVLHDSLEYGDLSMILNISGEESRLMLNRLHSRGLLAKDGNAFEINHLMYRQIVRVLKDRNIIHLT